MCTVQIDFVSSRLVCTTLLDDKLEHFMQEIHKSREEVRQSREKACKSREEVEQKLEAVITEVKREVNIAQEKTSLDVARKIGNTTYQFRKKGHEHHYTFNSGVEEAISSARSELLKVKPLSP